MPVLSKMCQEYRSKRRSVTYGSRKTTCIVGQVRFLCNDILFGNSPLFAFANCGQLFHLWTKKRVASKLWPIAGHYVVGKDILWDEISSCTKAALRMFFQFEFCCSTIGAKKTNRNSYQVSIFRDVMLFEMQTFPRNYMLSFFVS